MPAVTMLATYASAEQVLLKGKTYRVGDKLATDLLTVGSGESPEEPAAKLAKTKAKVTKITDRPDPGEVTEEEAGDDEDDDEGE